MEKNNREESLALFVFNEEVSSYSYHYEGNKSFLYVTFSMQGKITVFDIDNLFEAKCYKFTSAIRKS